VVNARVVLVAAAVVVCATACGNHARRNAITTYLNTVNSTETKLATPLQAVTKANEAFAKNQSSAQAQKQLAQAELTLKKLERQLAAIEPPPDAQHLKALLLELVNRELSLTRELRSLGTFVPRFETALQPLAASNTGLKKVLVRTAKGTAATKALDAEKATALRSYAETVEITLGELRQMEPPDVWRPAYAAEVSSLEELRTTATALSDALSADRAATVPGLLRRFDAAAVSTQSLTAQHAQIAAIDAYNKKVKSLTSLTRSIDLERNRLQRVAT
jgi:hypothetical protein